MGEVDVIGLVLWCPLTTLEPKAHALASENLAPKLPQQWSNLDSLQLLPRACQLREASPDGSLCQSII